MAYDKDEILKKAIQVVADEECVTIEEVCLYLPISKVTFYAWKMNESNDLKEAIEDQKVKLKKGMRRNWRKSDNPALQIAEYKLMASDEEIEKITVSKVKQDTTMKFENLPKIVINAGSSGNESI